MSDRFPGLGAEANLQWVTNSMFTENPLGGVGVCVGCVGCLFSSLRAWLSILGFKLFLSECQASGGKPDHPGKGRAR